MMTSAKEITIEMCYLNNQLTPVKTIIRLKKTCYPKWRVWGMVPRENKGD